MNVAKGAMTLGFVLLGFFSVNETGHSALGPAKQKKIKYRTNFGSCPSRSAGQMTLKLIKTFEETGSLKKVKEEIINQSMPERHFISDYKISYDPPGCIIFIGLSAKKCNDLCYYINLLF